MNIAGNLAASLLLAIGLVTGVFLLLWFLRAIPLIQRIRVSAIGLTLSAGLYLVLAGAGVSPDALSFKVAESAAVLFAVNALLQALDVLLWSNLVGRRHGIQVPRLLIDIFDVVVLAGVVLLILYRIFDVNLTALVVTSTVVSAVIGLALQDTLGNIIAGISLQMDRPFTVGDWANINGNEGEIMRMNWRTITLRTLDNNHVVVSNANTARHDIVNFSRPTVVQRRHVAIGLSYDYPPGEVKRVLIEAVRQSGSVLVSPPPEVFVSEFGDSAIVYDVRYWIEDFSQRQAIHDAVMTRLWYGIRRAGMSVPFPIRDVSVRQISEDHAVRQREQSVEDCYGQLRPLSIFATLTDEQIRRLAERAEKRLYTGNEILVHQGDTGDSLFVIRSGRARVESRDDRGGVTVLAHIPPGDFFGEMSLLTGERRSASVVAESDTEVVVVDKTALAEVLAGDFSSLEALSEVVENACRSLLPPRAAAAATPTGDPQPTRRQPDRPHPELLGDSSKSAGRVAVASGGAAREPVPRPAPGPVAVHSLPTRRARRAQLSPHPQRRAQTPERLPATASCIR